MSDKEPVLNLESREAIRGYLLKLIALPTIILTAVSFLLGFLIREGATQTAYTEAYSKAYASATQEFLRLSQSATETVETAKSGRRQIDDLLKDVKEVTEVAKALKEAKNLVEDTSKRLASDPSFVSAVTAGISTSGKTEAAGYGSGAWINTVKSARCPAGYFATGVEVVYGGTCNSQCNADGGTVREVRVTCQSLAAK